MAGEAAIDIATFMIRHKSSILSQPDSIRGKLASKELIISSRDAHVRSVLCGATGAFRFRAAVHVARATYFLAQAAKDSPGLSLDDDLLNTAFKHMGGAIGFGVCALASSSLAKVLPRRQREQLKPKEQALLREVEAVRDAQRKGTGVIIPPHNALHADNTTWFKKHIVTVESHDGSLWKATRFQ